MGWKGQGKLWPDVQRESYHRKPGEKRVRFGVSIMILWSMGCDSVSGKAGWVLKMPLIKYQREDAGNVSREAHIGPSAG
jgi:hypothetical protein